MNIFFSVFILTIFFFSLRLIDKLKFKRLNESITEEEQKFLKGLGFYKNE